ncbi:MAG: glycosyl transferase [Mucilaginibacter sp.]|nr:glycosyl transferase [Mucilaginibacter sp.]
MPPKITIITPSYNQGQFIEETILSVIGQDYPNLEYIIIDGGSTDDTVDIIKKYEKHITYWVSEKDTGQSNAINKGLKIASGDIINWLNSDDVLMPGSLALIVQKFNEHPDAIMVHGRIQYFGASNYYSRNLSKKDIETRYAAHICMPQPACFFKKKLIDEQGLLDETLHFSMDTDLYVRAGLHYSIVQVDDIFAKFRLHNSSKSVSVFNKTFLADNKLIFSRVLHTLSAFNEISELKKLNLFVEPEYAYNKTGKTFDTHKLLFYFLEHRLLTIHSHGDKKTFKTIFSYLFRKYNVETFSSNKLLLYRFSLFLPSSFLHALARLRYRSKAGN